jgi:Tfp pilus assembly protein PilN
MSQQLNLCAPILRTKKRYFLAQAMGNYFVVFILLLSVACSAWVWRLNVQRQGTEQGLESQSRELKSNQLALEKGQSGAGTNAKYLAKKLQVDRALLLQREQLLEALKQGLFEPGWGHSGRLKLVAQSIPPKVWLTEIKADESQLQLSGFTLETSALNEWLKRLEASPLMGGKNLSSVKVEYVSGSTAPPLWGFSMVSLLAKSMAKSGGAP